MTGHIIKPPVLQAETGANSERAGGLHRPPSRGERRRNNHALLRGSLSGAWPRRRLHLVACKLGSAEKMVMSEYMQDNRVLCVRQHRIRAKNLGYWRNKETFYLLFCRNMQPLQTAILGENTPRIHAFCDLLPILGSFRLPNFLKFCTNLSINNV